MNSWIEIDRKALVHNVKVFQDILSGSDTRLSLVLKSNAYGHGLKEVYGVCKDLGIEDIAVAYLREASHLRDLGYTGNIFMLTPIFKEDLQAASDLGVEVEIGGQGFLKDWSFCKNRPKGHLKIDTGLSRQGFTLEKLDGIISFIKEHDLSKDLRGVFTHFANVEDVLEQTYAKKQIDLFNKACNKLEKAGIHLLRHASASSAILLLDEARFDMVRLGISLYGLWPSQLTRTSYESLKHDNLELRPVLSWKSRLASIKKIGLGQFVGYGCTYRTVKDTLVGVIPVGYFDGFFRSAGEIRSYVLIRGQRAPIIGRVSMNLITVDLTDVHGVEENDLVTLIGKDGGEEISAGTFGDWSGTIHYEVVARLSSELKRIVVG